jgi:Helix-turn-helix domain
MDFSQRMNMKEAAAYLGRSPHWLSVNRERLAIPSYLIGGCYSFLKEDLDRWISEQQTTSKRTPKALSGGKLQHVKPITL